MSPHSKKAPARLPRNMLNGLTGESKWAVGLRVKGYQSVCVNPAME